MAYSIWLEFDDTSTSMLRREISALSAELGSPVFEPHLTLIGDMDLPVESVMLLAEEFAKCGALSRLRVLQVSTSSEYFMALYLSMLIPDDLARTRKQLSRHVSPDSHLLDEPHVSLAYGCFDSDVHAQLASRMENTFTGTSFGVRCVSMVQSSKQTPISEWRTVYQWPVQLDEQAS